MSFLTLSHYEVPDLPTPARNYVMHWMRPMSDADRAIAKTMLMSTKKQFDVDGDGAQGRLMQGMLSSFLEGEWVMLSDAHTYRGFMFTEAHPIGTKIVFCHGDDKSSLMRLYLQKCTHDKKSLAFESTKSEMGFFCKHGFTRVMKQDGYEQLAWAPDGTAAKREMSLLASPLGRTQEYRDLIVDMHEMMKECIDEQERHEMHRAVLRHMQSIERAQQQKEDMAKVRSTQSSDLHRRRFEQKEAEELERHKAGERLRKERATASREAKQAAAQAALQRLEAQSISPSRLHTPRSKKGGRVAPAPNAKREGEKQASIEAAARHEEHLRQREADRVAELERRRASVRLSQMIQRGD